MFSNYLPGIRQDVVQYGYPAGHFYNYVSDGADDTTLWYNSPSRFDPSSPNHLHNSFESTYKFYTCSTQANYFPQQHATTNPDIFTHSSGSYIRVIKRRTTANKKERKRTNSINKAFFFLRNCIPNVPADTKLSKIKTLRLATSYISYLTRALETDETLAGFEVELGKISRKSNCNPFHVGCSTDELFSPKSVTKEESSDSKRSNERTGWPQHVWDSELKQEQPL